MTELSTGIVLFLKSQNGNLENSENLSSLAKSCERSSGNLENSENLSSLAKSSEFLIIKRKNTVTYHDFINGNYYDKMSNGVENLLSQMTEDEKTKIMSSNFGWTDGYMK